MISEEHVVPVVGTFVCVLLASLCAGMTMGVVSLDSFDLKILLATDPEDCVTIEDAENLRDRQKYARRILPLVERHHLTLVTLLLMNSLANEALPLFIDQVLGKVAAIFFSVLFVLIFGEILPSAVFTGPNGLWISSLLAPVLNVLVVLTYVVSKPLAMVLDALFGAHDENVASEGAVAHLKALVRLHGASNDDATLELVAQRNAYLARKLGNRKTIRRHGNTDDTEVPKLKAQGISDEAIRLIYGALDMHRYTASSICTPWKETFVLHAEDVLDEHRITHIVFKGHSRIPVVDGSSGNVRGLLIAKKLAAVDADDRRKVGSLGLRQPVHLSPNLPLTKCLHEMERLKSHFAIVSTNPEELMDAVRCERPVDERKTTVLGCVTLLDVVQALIAQTFHDEDSFGVKSSLARAAESRRDIARALRGEVDGSKLFTVRKLHELADRARQRVRERQASSQAADERTPLVGHEEA